MATSIRLTRKDITYWVIFLMYSFVITFSLLIFSNIVETEIVLTSINLTE